MKYLKITFIALLMAIFLPKASFAQDWADLNRFREANSKLNAPTADENRIVFMGNSITIGWQSADPDFFSNTAYINRGISGQTTPQMLVRFRQDVINLQPKVVVILAGTNDIAGNTGPSTVEMIRDNIFSMCEIAKANGIQVVISSVLPVFDYPWKPGLEPAEKIIQLNTYLKEYAQQNNLVYLDYFSAMVDERKGLQKDLGGDGVHPNRKGYDIMKPLVLGAIDKALSKG